MDRAPSRAGWRGDLVAAIGLALPSRCALCEADGAAPLCRACADLVRRSGFAGGPRLVAPDPPPEGMPPTWAGAPFADRRGLLTAYKDEDRADLKPALAALLGEVVSAARLRTPRLARLGSHGGGLLLVPAPSSRSARRRRGSAPLLELARLVARDQPGRVVVRDALELGRAVADQSGLGHDARRINLEGALRVRGRARDAVEGAHILLLDDVVTTGATLAEAARALAVGGAGSVTAVTIAATIRAPRVALVD